MASRYFTDILRISEPYLKEVFDSERDITQFKRKVQRRTAKNRQEAIKKFTELYIQHVKNKHRSAYTGVDKKLTEFLTKKDDGVKLIWGDCLATLQGMQSESVHLMVTSPPYYNARDYSYWSNLDSYLDDMRAVIREAYRVLDNHRVFVFNVGDIFDNDNLRTKSVWGKRRIPLGAYFTKIFEEEGFTFVDDFMWDKGEVQSARHKNGSRPFPFYQYPVNVYEHILIFHKHRLDLTRYPCPVCGTLKVNGNTQSEVGIQSWECKNLKCPERSASNRGKRFSLKSLWTQASKGDKEKIPEAFIKKWRKDIVRINPVIKINNKGENVLGHTAPFPFEIPEYAIRMFSYRNERVLDPFGGSFTSVIAAQKLGRIGIGIELHKDMFREASLRNIRKYTNGRISEFTKKSRRS